MRRSLAPLPGTAQFSICNGPPNGTYYLFATLLPGAFPNGWFYGVDIPLQEVVNQVNAGYPFTGGLGAGGGATIGPFAGLPPGLVLYTVALGFTGGLGVPSANTPAMSYTIP